MRSDSGSYMTNYLNASHGLASWLLTRDHKRIALLYLVTITVFFFIGGLMAVGIRLELVTPAGDFVTADTYNKMFTLHGVLMVFLFLLPSIPAVLGNFLIPPMIGAKDLAYPRINLLSWYLLVIGGAFTVYAMLTGGVDTGWTFYTPYSTAASNTSVIPTALGIFITGFSSILTGLNFIVTIHRMRAPGMTWFRLPLFVWSHYATSLIQVLATPVIAITIVLVFVERVFGFGIFDPTRGGDPVLFQHLFWFYSHPAVYIMILPAMGVMSELIAAFSKKMIFGYSFVAFSSLAIAVFGFLVWAHHLFVAGISTYAAMVFSFLSFVVAIPSAVKVFNWTATLYKGAVSFETPMLYAFGFLGLFTIGGLTGIFLATLGLDVHVHDTYFVDRTLPLHHGGWGDHGISRRLALLVAQDDRPAVSRFPLEDFGDPDLRRLQSHVLSAVHPWLHGYAASLPCLSRGISAAEHPVICRRIHPRRRLPVAGLLPALVAEVGTRKRHQSLGSDGARMGDSVAAPHREFRGGAARDLGTV